MENINETKSWSFSLEIPKKKEGGQIFCLNDLGEK